MFYVGLFPSGKIPLPKAIEGQISNYKESLVTLLRYKVISLEILAVYNNFMPIQDIL